MRLDRDRLVQEAIDAAGSDDFGADTWQEGLDRLLDALVHEADLHEIGVEVAVNDVVTGLKNRLEIETIRVLYAQLGRSLEPATEARMRDFLAAHPGDGGGGRCRWEDTGLDAGVFRERVRGYQERYAVPSEPVGPLA